jgi:CcmD family protein
MNKNRFSLIVFRFVLAVMALMTSSIGFAQEKVEMADTMRSNGKIYVVVAVCLIILIGLFLYVMSVDRKLRKLEKEV